MSCKFRFAIISDPHIALPHTIWDHPNRFHLVEVSIPALEAIFEQLQHLNLDFLLIPGDLTQHGEPENHAWLSQRLLQLPYPVYVIPGNHDVVARDATEKTIGLADFPYYYQKCGYRDPSQLYYVHPIAPGARLIGLNSNGFDADGKQLSSGFMDQAQLQWLEQVLNDSTDQFTIVMLHHNVLEHVPGQTRNPLGRRYMLSNAAELLAVLQSAGIQLILTGHLHVQDIAQSQGIYEITTGSLVSYPHPYRVLEFQQDHDGNRWLTVESNRVMQVPGWPNLLHTSREWMGERSFPFMLKLLTHPPLSLPIDQAEKIALELRYFWADIAHGDTVFDFAHLPQPVQQFLTRFGAIGHEGQPQLIDNFATLRL